jgi:hypothetical protein
MAKQFTHEFRTVNGKLEFRPIAKAGTPWPNGSNSDMWDCSCSKPARKPAPVDKRTAYLKAQLEAIKKGEVRL